MDRQVAAVHKEPRHPRNKVRLPLAQPAKEPCRLPRTYYISQYTVLLTMPGMQCICLNLDALIKMPIEVPIWLPIQIPFTLACHDASNSY